MKNLVLAIQELGNPYPNYKNPGPLFWEVQNQVRQTRGAVSVAGRGEVYNEKEKGCSMPVQQSTGSKWPQRGPARCPSWHGDTDHTRPKQAAPGPVVLWHWPQEQIQKSDGSLDL